MHNVLVCGYGCHLTENLKGYLNYVARCLSGSNEVNLVVTSGGCNNQKTAPGIREADLVRDHLLVTGVSQPIICEIEAVTSMDNLVNTEKLLRIRGNGDIPLVIFCDSIRRFKVEYMARKVFKCTVEVVGYDFGRSFKARMAQRFLLAPVEIAAFHIPMLDRMLHAYRLKQNQNR